MEITEGERERGEEERRGGGGGGGGGGEGGGETHQLASVAQAPHFV